MRVEVWTAAHAREVERHQHFGQARGGDPEPPKLGARKRRRRSSAVGRSQGGLEAPDHSRGGDHNGGSSSAEASRGLARSLQSGGNPRRLGTSAAGGGPRRNGPWRRATRRRSRSRPGGSRLPGEARLSSEATTTRSRRRSLASGNRGDGAACRHGQEDGSSEATCSRGKRTGEAASSWPKTRGSSGGGLWRSGRLSKRSSCLVRRRVYSNRGRLIWAEARQFNTKGGVAGSKRITAMAVCR